MCCTYPVQQMTFGSLTWPWPWSLLSCPLFTVTMRRPVLMAGIISEHSLSEPSTTDSGRGSIWRTRYWRRDVCVQLDPRSLISLSPGPYWLCSFRWCAILASRSANTVHARLFSAGRRRVNTMCYCSENWCVAEGESSVDLDLDGISTSNNLA